MKKSEILKTAQRCVLGAIGLSNDIKLEVLRELMDKEDLALYTERQEEKE